MKNLIFAASLLFALAACHTIVIKNGEDAATNYQQTYWHHVGVLRLVEFSDPVNLYAKCENKNWESVRTRTGPLQVLIRIIPYVSYIYAPEEVAVACSTH